MWTAIYMATGKREAEQIISILKNEGFLVKSNYALNDGKENLYEILAPEFEAEDIKDFLKEQDIY